MSTTKLVATLALGLLLAPLAAEAQPTGKVYRIGFLWDSPAVFPDAIEAFRQGLRDLGYVEATRDPAGGAQGGPAIPADPGDRRAAEGPDMTGRGQAMATTKADVMEWVEA